MAFTLYDFGETPLLREVEKLMGKQVESCKEHPWPMENFEAPVRDKHGKIINAEDAEARQAARERHNARRAEQRKRAEKSEKPEKVEKPVSVEKAERKPVPRLKPAAREPEPEGEIPYYSLDLLPPGRNSSWRAAPPLTARISSPGSISGPPAGWCLP